MRTNNRVFLNEKDKVQSEVLDWLRFPLIILVVFVHCPGMPDLSSNDVLNVQLQCLSQMDVYNYVRICLSYVLSSIAVPTFFLISGYYFFYGIEDWNIHVYKEKLRKRWRSLVVPYLLWNVIAFIFVLGLKLRYLVLGYYHVSDILGFIKKNNLYEIFWNGSKYSPTACIFGNVLSPALPADGPLWYLRDLIVCMFFSFLVFYFIKYLKYYGLILLCFCFVTGLWVDIPGLGLTSIVFFSIGAYFGINKKNIVCFLNKGHQFVYFITFVLLLICVRNPWRITHTYQIANNLFIIFGVWSIINIAYGLHQKSVCKVHPLITESVFFIFAIHSIGVIGISESFLEKLLPSDFLLINYLHYFLTPVLVIGICIFLYVLLKRFIPKTLSVLVGGR